MKKKKEKLSCFLKPMLTPENPTHMRLINTNLPADYFLAKTKASQIEDPLHVNLSQNSFRVTSTLNTSAVSFLIRPIFLNGSPFKITDLIVRTIAVQMPGLEAFRTYTLESLQNQPMHQSRMLYAVSSKSNESIPIQHIVFKDAPSTHGALQVLPRKTFNSSLV